MKRIRTIYAKLNDIEIKKKSKFAVPQPIIDALTKVVVLHIFLLYDNFRRQLIKKFRRQNNVKSLMKERNQRKFRKR